ncbi:bifunctional transcriptional activator/DNA repair protein Ada [Parvularcula sp. ZS-1/3]|uniref:methylated-DNA--[protein]-cysteine S-methyltransferase n=1 Tax=Parvularcula mediterranea TaxID=2732508 RepID=A0A7Y3RKX1_9PROT|nr:trifunctional transcriptional activator/DNA repair protein Ada/methylated-DNA--[protein]-cysteine S-methyltransferase [Parvularcula mediterranea]NNU15895.1 bifunctional transcriptional activator/DNA repair protein Ada [Parvularcula mediterranea]
MDSLPASQAELFEAFDRRDPNFDGEAFAAVTSTGIFCRFSCPARRPKPENLRFFGSAEACMEAGFRPCRRCRPLENGRDPLVASLLKALSDEPAKVWSEADIAALGHDPSTVRRAFKRSVGKTFLELARLSRIGAAAKEKAAGAKVIDAQLAAGFESPSGFRAAFAKLLGRAPSALNKASSLGATAIQTPLGPMVAIGDDKALWLLEFADRKELPQEIASVETQAGAQVSLAPKASLATIEAELSAFFSGDKLSFETPVIPYGTVFTGGVHRALTGIPPGGTISYRTLAERIGKPSAMRAVARANASNRLAIIVPCHRVIAADGKISGYAGGVWRKRWLLEHERRVVNRE